MPTAAKAIARTLSREGAVPQFCGMLVVSLFPALFWTLAIAGVGAAVGHTPSTASLVAFGAAVAAFCGAVFQALVTQRD